MPLTTLTNPFRSSVVSDPWELPETDIANIHQPAFARCREAVAAIRARRHTTGVLVHGEAGSGKTHLLARLRARIAREAEADGPGGLQDAIFVSVRLQTSARLIWRHLRDCLVGDLLRRASDGSTQLERLLLHLLGEQGLISGDQRQWLSQRRQAARHNSDHCDELSEMFDSLGGGVRLSNNLRAVIEHLLLGRHRGLAAAWLHGESLSETDLQRLGITSASDNDEELEVLARQLVVALSSLARAELPIIFCFDQVEALQLDPQDVSGLVAFGQLISVLQAETRHALLISCIQSSFLDTLHQAVRGADLARIREFAEVALNPLTWDESQQLIRARLDSLAELRPLRAAQSDPLWPLRAEEVKTVAVAGGFTARRLLARCADLFEVQRRGDGTVRPIPARTREGFLNQALEDRRQKALEESKPDQTDQIIAHGLPSLLHLAGRGWRPQTQNVPGGVDLLFESPAGRVAVGMCNSRHANGLLAKLNRLHKLVAGEPATQVVLMRDSRLPIGPKAVRTREAREELLRKGARWVEPSLEALAALDALRRLLSDAKSGELDNHGETVGLQTVQDWLAANLASELKDLAAEVLPQVPGDSPIAVDDWSLYEDIAELLQWHHVVAVADVAAKLERDEDEVAECVQRHAHQIGVLGEPPVTLFRLVNDVAAG